MSKDKDFENNINKIGERPVEKQEGQTGDHSEDYNAEEMSALAREYAKALAAKGLRPGDPTFIEPETLLADAKTNEASGAEAEAEVNAVSVNEENQTESQDEDQMIAMAREYARVLAAKGLRPGDPTFAEPEQVPAEAKPLKASDAEVEAVASPVVEAEEEPASDNAAPEIEELPAEEVSIEETSAEKEELPAEDIQAENDVTAQIEETSEDKDGKNEAVSEGENNKTKKRKRRKPLKIKRRSYEKSFKGIPFLAWPIELGDAIRGRGDAAVTNMGKDFIRAAHSIATSYRNTRRSIWISLLGVTVVITGLLVLFDRFTVYEYAYNGKVLGYVKEQEEVTDVLEIAGQKLTENSGSSHNVEFVANKNVTFNMVDAGGKVLDTSDSAVNKLVYMTDIETEAYGVYDGEDLVAVVKNNNDAENLLVETQAELSTPDRGMKLISSEFANALDIKPLNVLLISVLDNASAKKQMVEGGEMEIYHIVEEGENLASLQSDFSVGAENIFDETNSEIVTAPEQGDKVCIHKQVEPLSVTMVEQGHMKEVVEFKTIKEESDEYYKGDTVIKQDGEDGIQLFEGTITKERGEVVDRKTDSIENVREVQDKIIIVGTAERPKTAATGTFAMPLKDSYQLSSPFGPRWGRMHTGLDMARGTGIPIYASDGGTVIRAGYNGGYGLCVDIDHENGYVTRYAHCSKILVSVGDKVYQGQNISLMGSTGNSTGPHLHFEIIQNGTAINPAPKLGL